MVSNDAEHLLKMGSVSGPYSQNAVSFPRYGVRLGHLRNAADHLPHSVGWHPAFAVNLDKSLDGPAQCGRFNFGCEAPDHAALAEPIHSSFGGRCGESDVVPEHGEALTTMVCQPRKDLVINFIKTQ